STTRLVVGDTTGLDEPYRTPTFEPIGISGGGAKVDAATIELVDPATGQLFVSRTNPPVPASGTFPDAATTTTWASLENLQLVGAALASTVPVVSTAGFYTGGLVEIDDGTTKSYRVITAIDVGNRTLTVGTPLATLDAPADPSLRRAYIRTLEFDVLVYERDPSGKAVLKESFTNLTWNPDTTTASAARYYLTKINDDELGSQLIRFDEPLSMPPPLDPTGQPQTEDGFLTFLTGGDDGSPLSNIDLVGHDNGPHQRTGIQALSERKDIALVAVPGVTDELVQQQLITHCELLRYRFAVLDGRPSLPQVTDILSHRNNYDTEYAGYYEPWLKSVDLTTGKTLLVPPSGHVLGICARVDNERGVHKAPANETVRGILDVELPFTDGEQDVLNPLGVNLIREFEGRGIRVWGARTLSSDPEWKYINVRRLFIFLEHSIDNGTQWVVFEPNNEALWSRVKATIESFLFGVWKTGALMGTKPEEAYFVRCDRTTMTQDDLDNGRLICLIGVAPTYPAEFVIFRIGQFTASSNVA
ncbi:MAG: phage tail sheath family protein, partial [Kofleriaceae bacterium]